MKKELVIGYTAFVVTLFVSALTTVKAQTNNQAEEAVEQTGQAIEKGAKKVSEKTAEIAAKGVSKVADKTYRGKMAPDGSNVYIDSNNKKYYINKRGEKIFLKPGQIKDRPKTN